MRFINASRFSILLLALFVFQPSHAAPLEWSIAKDGARLTRLVFASGEIPLQDKGGGFEVFDFNASRPLALQDEAFENRPEGARAYRAKAGDLSLEAVFAPKADGSVCVSGILKNANGGDRAVILRYRIPMKTEGALFDYDPGQSQRVGPGARALGTIFPVAAMAQGKACAALAIPPSFPCCFGMIGAPEGLGVEFYLGLAPDTKRFPNEARFEFLIYGAEAAWPFRSALARYYDLFPDYYARRLEGGGFWNKHEPGDIDAALPFYRFQVLGSKEQGESEIERRKKMGVLSFLYLLVGNLKVKEVPAVSNYDESMKAYEAFARSQRGTQSNQSPDKTRLSLDLIERCACKTADGRYVLYLPKKGDKGAEGDKDLTGAAQGAKSAKGGTDKTAMNERRGKETKGPITFIINPTPDLFAEQGVETMGRQAIRACEEFLNTNILDGFEFDSLGSRWPAHLNFRRDHFPYARYPLTFDDQGRVALHNCSSHYECIETLRGRAREKGKYIFGNGVYTYSRKPGTEQYEHYNSQENGRFFLAALLDVLGRENSDLFERSSLERMRAMAGNKLYEMVMYNWDDPQLVRNQMNRNLVYAVFGIPSDKNSGYLVSPKFARDKELITWFVKNCRILHGAGWRPVTRARVNSPDIACERYGEGAATYFALLNFAGEPRDCQLTIDCGTLGLSARESQALRVREIARDAKIETETKGGECRVRLRLAPNEAHILEAKLEH